MGERVREKENYLEIDRMDHTICKVCPVSNVMSNYSDVLVFF